MRTGVPIDDLRNYEAGTKLPARTTFQRIARGYRLPEATLARNTPPKTPPKPEDFRFRTLDGKLPALGFETLVAISNVQRYLNNLTWIREEDSNIKLPVVPEYQITDDPTEIAKEERSRFGLSSDAPLSWADADAAFRHWRGIIESMGVAVFVEKFPIEDCRGFSIIDESNNAAVIVNWSDTVQGARIFSLLHEYAHIIIKRPGISDPTFDNRSAIEGFCNKFAAEILLPREALAKHVLNWPNRVKDWNYDDIRDIAALFRVSQQAVALRLEQLGVARSGFFDDFKKHQAAALPRLKPTIQKDEGKKSGGLAMATRVIHEVGIFYTSAVIDAIDHGAIDQFDAAGFLKAAPRHFPRMRERVTKHRKEYGRT